MHCGYLGVFALKYVFGNSLISVQSTGIMKFSVMVFCPVAASPVGGPTHFFIDILFVPGALGTGRLTLVGIFKSKLILFSYPVHVAGGVRHHGGVGAPVDVIPQWGFVPLQLNSQVTTLGHGERPGKTVLVDRTAGGAGLVPLSHYT